MSHCHVEMEYKTCRPKHCSRNLSTADFMPQMRLIDSTARLPPSQILLGISGSNCGCKVSPQPCHELVKLVTKCWVDKA